MKLIRQIATGHDPICRCFSLNHAYGVGSYENFCGFNDSIDGMRIWATLYHHAWSEMGSRNLQRYGGSFPLGHN